MGLIQRKSAFAQHDIKCQRNSMKIQVALPLRNIISMVAAASVTWAYFGIIERLNQ